MIGGYMTYEGPRTLMARPVCLTESLSKCLVTPFVESVYNQHSYREERAQVLKMLAGLVENILHDDSDKKVRRLRG